MKNSGKNLSLKSPVLKASNMDYSDIDQQAAKDLQEHLEGNIDLAYQLDEKVSFSQLDKNAN